MNDVAKPAFPLRFDNQPDQKPLTFEMNDSGRGIVLTTRGAKGETQVTFFPVINDDGPLGQMVNYMGECAQAFIGDHDNTIKNYIGDELSARVRGTYLSRFHKACNELQKIAIKEAQDVAASRAGLMAVDPATAANSHLRADALAKWNAAKQADREAIAIDDNTPHEFTAALIESGALAAVSDRARNAALARYMAQRHVAKSGSTAAHQIAPSYENPIACGPDHRAAREAAMRELDKLTSRSEALKTVGDMLRGLCDSMSIATGISKHDAYRMLIAK